MAHRLGYGGFATSSSILLINSPQNLEQIFAKSLTLQGFIVIRLEAEYDKEFYEVMPKAISEGKIKWREELWDGLHKVGDAVLAIQEGKNKGKIVVRVASE